MRDNNEKVALCREERQQNTPAFNLSGATEVQAVRKTLCPPLHMYIYTHTTIRDPCQLPLRQVSRAKPGGTATLTPLSGPGQQLSASK